MVRVDRVTGETMSVRPQPADGETELRWNWDTPLDMSPHDPKRDLRRGRKSLSLDRPRADRGRPSAPTSPKGANRNDDHDHGRQGQRHPRSRENDGISTLADDRVIRGVAEARRPALRGTDDGNLAVSKDGGKTWANVFAKVPGVPADIYVSGSCPPGSTRRPSTRPSTATGRTTSAPTSTPSRDYGETWQSIAANLAGEVARTLTEDLQNPDVLYLGTETGLFVTIDRGEALDPHQGEPADGARRRDHAAAARQRHDPRDARARAVGSSITSSQSRSTPRRRRRPRARLFTLPPYAMYRRPARDRNYEFWGDQTFFGENPPQAAVIAWHLTQEAGDVTLRVADASGREVREDRRRRAGEEHAAGIQAACWDLRVTPGPEVATPNRGGSGGQADREEREPLRRRLRTAAGAGPGAAAPAPGPSCCPAPTPSRSSSTGRRWTAEAPEGRGRS